MTRDRSTGIVALVLGAVIGVMAFQLPPSTISGDIGPAVFPFFSAAILVICGAALLVKGSDEKPAFGGSSFKRLAVIFGATLIYCIAMNFLGFILPTMVILFVLSTLFAEDLNIPWWHRLLYAVFLTLAIYLLFHNALNLKLPSFDLL